MSLSRALTTKRTLGADLLRRVAVPFLTVPACPAILLFAGTNLLALVAALKSDDYEGADAAGVRSFLSGEYRGEVFHALALVVALSVLIGLCLGLIVSVTIRLRRALYFRERTSRGVLAIQSAIGVAIVCLLMWTDDIVARPALYQDFLFNQGGLRGSVQILLTDHMTRSWLWGGAALAVTIWFSAPAAFFRRRVLNWRAFAALAAVTIGTIGLFALPWQCLRIARARDSNDRHLNVLVIAADSLRPDRITPKIAPNLFKLAQQGVVFSKAYTPLARTFPAWVSLMTGKYPHHHGVRNMFPRWETRTKDFQAIPASFAAAGYATSVISDFAGDIFRRIDLGFATRNTPTFTMRELLLERILQRDIVLMPWLRGSLARWMVPTLREMHVASDAEVLSDDTLAAIDQSGSQPFFTTVFYSTTHFPYAAPSPYYRDYMSPNYKGRYRYAKADTLLAEAELSQADVLQVQCLFDGAVAAVDAAVGRLLRGLESRNLTAHTIIVVTADHGESLYENNRGQGHGDHLFGDDSLHVPLFFVKPGGVHEEVPTPVSIVDLAPTLCTLARVECGRSMDGMSLAGVFEGHALLERPVFAETGLWFTEKLPEVPPELRIPYPDLLHLTEIDRSHADEVVIRREWDAITTAAKHRMVRDSRYKLLYMPTRNGPKYTLFDTLTDPGESVDISSTETRVAEHMRELLMQWMLSDASIEIRDGVLVPRVTTDGTGFAR